MGLLGAPPRAQIESRIRSVEVQFYNFAGVLDSGQLEVDSSLEREVHEIFAVIRRTRFPVRLVRPMREFRFDDDTAMTHDNSSGWNWREVKGTGKMSWHALGRAIDLNPRENPWVREGRVRPLGARHDVSVPGTLQLQDSVVQAFLKRGWKWGGRWQRVRDWQHFEKPLRGTDLSIPASPHGSRR